MPLFSAEGFDYNFDKLLQFSETVKKLFILYNDVFVLQSELYVQVHRGDMLGFKSALGDTTEYKGL